jgi:hypothetical protein
MLFDILWMLLVLVVVLAGIGGIGLLQARKRIRQPIHTDEGKDNDNHDD